MKSAGRRELRHPSSSNMRYSTKLYHVEVLDHNVHELVLVSGMEKNANSRELRNGQIRFQLRSNKSIKENGN